MRIPVVPLTVRVTLLPRAHQATPERPQLAPTEPRQPAHPRLVLMVPPLPAPPRLVLMAHPLPERLRLALMVPLQRAPRPPALPLLALMAPRQLALLPPAHPLLARTAGLLATVLLAARPLLPCATTVWVSAVHRLRLLRRRSPLILTRYLPVRATISAPRRTRSIRTLAATRRAWIMWTSSPVIPTRFPTASTILSKPQVVPAAVAPMVPRRVTTSRPNLLQQVAGSLRESQTIRGTPMVSLRTGTITIFSVLRTGRTLPTWITAQPTLTVRRAVPMSSSARALAVAMPAWALRDRTSALAPSAAAIRAALATERMASVAPLISVRTQDMQVTARTASLIRLMSVAA